MLRGTEAIGAPKIQRILPIGTLSDWGGEDDCALFSVTMAKRLSGKARVGSGDGSSSWLPRYASYLTAWRGPEHGGDSGSSSSKLKLFTRQANQQEQIDGLSGSRKLKRASRGDSLTRGPLKHIQAVPASLSPWRILELHSAYADRAKQPEYRLWRSSTKLTALMVGSLVGHILEHVPIAARPGVMQNSETVATKATVGWERVPGFFDLRWLRVPEGGA
ncbi:hypothetical protein BX600DRAFT_501066 [Xylariales sp. PMI_506]|nr:hypothetical protein BX600DRAFT_501066 [Xylariales sp. PMI_506]